MNYPYSRQTITKDDIKKVSEVLKSKFITQGPVVKKFENSISNLVGSRYASATNSATSALHIACLAIGLKKGDYIWTAPNSFVASANCGVYCGAKVDFVDVDKNDFNIDVEKLELKLKSKKRRPKILITVHFAGQPTKQDKIWALAKKYNFYVIEDAAHSLGAKNKGILVGSCRWSDITVFSFHPVKTITSGEGGMATTNNLNLYKKMELFKNHGISRDQKNLKKKRLGFWYYEQHHLGFNYRMSELSAALGLNQMKYIKRFVAMRNKCAKIYGNLLKNLAVRFQKIHKDNYSSYHLFIIILEKRFKKKYNNIFKDLRKLGVMVNLHYLPIHLQPFYKKFGFKNGDFPISEDYASRALSIPIYPGLKIKDQTKIKNILEKILLKNSKF